MHMLQCALAATCHSQHSPIGRLGSLGVAKIVIKNWVFSPAYKFVQILYYFRFISHSLLFLFLFEPCV